MHKERRGEEGGGGDGLEIAFDELFERFDQIIFDEIANVMRDPIEKALHHADQLSVREWSMGRWDCTDV